MGHLEDTDINPHHDRFEVDEATRKANAAQLADNTTGE
jgi:hypothetical protein